MKVKLLLVLTLATVVSTSGMALEITKGKLISHTEYTTGNLKLSFNDAANNNAKHDITKFLKKVRNNNNPVMITTNSQFFSNDVGQINQPYFFKGYSDATIVNNSNATKTYSVETTVCIESENTGDSCGSSVDMIQVDPESIVGVNKYPTIIQTFKNPGYYLAGMMVIVSPIDGSDTVTTSISTQSIKIVDSGKAKL